MLRFISTFLKKLYPEIVKSENDRFDVLVRAVEDYAIFTLDRTGHVQSWNAGAQRFKGYKAHEILGKHFSIFYPDEIREQKIPDSELEFAKTHGVYREEGQRVRKDGSLFWAYVVITAIYDDENRLTGFLKVTRDISEKKFAEENLRKVNESLEERVRERTAVLALREQELEEAKNLAESANKAKSTFVANLSHEIRTPLGALLGFADLLTDDQITIEEKKNAKEAILRNGQMLSALIDDVLDLSKIEAEKLELQLTPLKMKRLVEDLRTTFTPKAQAKGLRFEIETDASLPEQILVDGNRLRQILYNAIGNALKFTASGEIRIKCSRHQDHLYFEVSDTGIGISESQAAKLFRPFQQASESIHSHYGGTGLGLVLSKGLAKALGGDFVLSSSKEGSGSTFTLSIQCQVPTQNENEAPTSSVLSLAGKKILVVDDNADNRLLIKALLVRWKADVDLAVNGLDGIEKAQGKDFDLVLMDLQMPQLDGMSAVIRLRKEGYTKPIVAITAHAMKQERDNCLQFGFDAYLTKPIDRARLGQTLQELIV